MKTKIIAASLVAIIGLIVWSAIRGHNESEALLRMDNPPTLTEELPSLRASSKQAVLEFCTNNFVGFTRLINSSVMDYDDNPNKWLGTVTVEHINKVGGIERASANFKFALAPAFGAHRSVYCLTISDQEYRAAIGMK